MMEKQISKKKLERLCVQGGDFRRAGERLGGNLTIARLSAVILRSTYLIDVSLFCDRHHSLLRTYWDVDT